MRETSDRRSLRFLVFVSSISLQFLSGLASDSSSPKTGTTLNSQGSSGSNIGVKILIGCVVAVFVGLLSYFLFKLWQKKKREEQYARLLKLFEEDDELELELGLRD